MKSPAEVPGVFRRKYIDTYTVHWRAVMPDRAGEMNLWWTNSRKGEISTSGNNRGAHDTRSPSVTDYFNARGTAALVGRKKISTCMPQISTEGSLDRSRVPVVRALRRLPTNTQTLGGDHIPGGSQSVCRWIGEHRRLWSTLSVKVGLHIMIFIESSIRTLKRRVSHEEIHFQTSQRSRPVIIEETK